MLIYFGKGRVLPSLILQRFLLRMEKEKHPLAMQYHHGDDHRSRYPKHH
jgi:hypothetical protein